MVRKNKEFIETTKHTKHHSNCYSCWGGTWV